MSLKDTLSVMVVDDTSVSRGLLTMGLEELQIRRVASCSNGAAALQALVANPMHLVISDYNMPGLDGLGLLKGLRENRSTQRIGFILVSGSATREIVEAGQRLGMNNFLKKPFTPGGLRACIQAVVGPL